LFFILGSLRCISVRSHHPNPAKAMSIYLMAAIGPERRRMSSPQTGFSSDLLSAASRHSRLRFPLPVGFFPACDLGKLGASIPVPVAAIMVR